MTNKYEELEHLYTNLGKIIFEGLSNYAKYDCCVLWTFLFLLEILTRYFSVLAV